MGQPPAHPGGRKPELGNIDDFWQGALVGGFGVGTFSRSYMKWLSTLSFRSQARQSNSSAQ